MQNRNLFIKATSLVCHLFLIGICALLTSILLVLLIICVKFNAATMGFYLLGLLLVGPTMGAMFQTVFETLNDSETSIFKTYFRYYHSGFRSSLWLWLPYYILVMILCADIYFIAMNGKLAFLTPLLFLILILSMISYVYSLILYTKFVMKTKDIIRFSLFLIINRPVKSLLFIVLLFALYVSFKHFGNLTIFWGLPLFSMLTLLFSRKLLEQIEMKYVS